MARLHNLDYLRGVTAFGIMIYHYLSWTLGKFSADTFLGRLGVYGVSIFYVLSGLTLFYVYFDKMDPTREQIFSFFKKRVLRIFPLLWLVTFLAIFISGKSPNITDLLLNLSGVFGFVKWDTYFSAGIWSIGNELVFYIFFPFFLFFTKNYKALMVLFSLVIFAVYLHFAFNILPDSAENEQWRNYVNPLNQVFLFLGGFFIGFFFNQKQFSSVSIIVLLIATIVLFIFYPVYGDQFNVKTGFNRLVFTVLSFVICFCFFKMSITLPKLVHMPLKLLGEASYSVYLLHPIIYELIGSIREYTFQFSESIRLSLSIGATLIISYFAYQYFEKYFMNLGRKKDMLLRE